MITDEPSRKPQAVNDTESASLPTSTPKQAREAEELHSFLADLQFNDEPGIDGLLGANMESKHFEAMVTAIEALIAQERAAAGIEAHQKIIDLIDNYKPDPNAPSFGSASGSFQNAGWKHYAEIRIAQLQAELEGK